MAPRHRLSVPVELEDGRGQCRDISNTGMFFEIDGSIEPGATIRVSLILTDVHPMPPVQLDASGRVVRVERLERRSGVAIEFTSIRFENAETWAALRDD